MASVRVRVIFFRFGCELVDWVFTVSVLYTICAAGAYTHRSRHFNVFFILYVLYAVFV